MKNDRYAKSRVVHLFVTCHSYKTNTDPQVSLPTDNLNWHERRQPTSTPVICSLLYAANPSRPGHRKIHTPTPTPTTRLVLVAD